MTLPRTIKRRETRKRAKARRALAARRPHVETIPPWLLAQTLDVLKKQFDFADKVHRTSY